MFMASPKLSPCLNEVTVLTVAAPVIAGASVKMLTDKLNRSAKSKDRPPRLADTRGLYLRSRQREVRTL